MEQFKSLEKTKELFREQGCEGKENCYFLTYQDYFRAKSGLVGGLEYPYNGILINKTENEFGMFYLKYQKGALMNVGISNLVIGEDAYHFIPNKDIKKVTVKRHSFLNSKLKSIIIKTVDRKHCLVAKVNEPLLPYHDDNLAKFISQYEKK